jgi:hypothetical protein
MKAAERRYLEWVSSLPCSHCGTMPVQAHHLRDIALGAGQGRKVAHHLTMPVCYQCHTDCHDGIYDKETQFRWALKTISKAFEQQLIKML